jgi:hypothetical protein
MPFEGDAGGFRWTANQLGELAGGWRQQVKSPAGRGHFDEQRRVPPAVFGTPD